MILHIRGLVAAKDRILREVDAHVARRRANGGPLFEWSDIDALRMRAGELSRHVTGICDDRDMEPADMASPSRRAFQLLSFFASEHHLERHLETLRMLGPAGGGDAGSSPASTISARCTASSAMANRSGSSPARALWARPNRFCGP